MADVITRFKLETTQYDSKLRDSVKGLKEVVKMAELAGKDFKGFEKNTLEAAKALGTVETGATNSKDKVKELVGAFNDMAKTYNTMSKEIREGDVGKAISDSLTQLSGRIKEAKQELYSLGDTAKSSGGLFGGGKLDGALQVFAGNVMTKIAGVGMSLASELGDAVKQGIELAKQGEGIRIAFERLGRGDILHGLREATHGTVTDLELMKAAVKFNDFKLPISELGTMLAFAQQKAKDTGQSVDYMVDSIVTGLGRKSLMILDNLGLSAAEIKEKMKETGDMTKAVGEIIREQMAKAGDYVETAADRAAQANVSLQNKMEELGRKFAPVQEASDQLWTSIKIGILDIVGGPLARLLNGLTQAGQLRNAIADAGGSDRVTADINRLKGSNYKNAAYRSILESYSREEQAARNNWLKSQKGGMGSIAIWENRYNAAKALREEFQSRGREVLHPTATNTPVPVTITNTPTGGGGEKVDIDAVIRGQYDTAMLKGASAGIKATELEGPSAAWSAYVESIKQGSEEAKDSLSGLTKAFESLNKSEGESAIGNLSSDAKVAKGSFKDAASAVGNLGSALSGLDDPAAKIAGTVAQAIANIALAFSSADLKDGQTGNVWYWIAATAAGLSAMVTTISSIKAATNYAEGGMIKGNSYSGDNLMAMGPDGLVGLNAGELILNRAQQNSIAGQLQGYGGGGTSRIVGVLKGEDIVLMADRWGMRTGRGELLFGKNL